MSVQLNQQIADKNEAINSKEVEISDWKNKKDPEPLRHKDTIMARQELDEKNIPCVPFYQAVEFKAQVTSEQRERLESAISQMGFLDALIVPGKYTKSIQKSDKVLIPNPQFFKHTLAELLYPTPVEGVGVTAEEIANVLQSILLEGSDDGLAVVNEDGTYQISLLQGHAPKEEASRYIGQEARKLYRQEMIAKLTKELRELEEKLAELIKAQEYMVKRQEVLNNESASFPLTNDVKTAYDTWQRLIMEVDILEKEVEIKNTKVKKLLELLNSIQDSLREHVKNITLPVNKEAYEAAVNNMHTYKKNLHQLELQYKDYCNSTISFGNYQQNLLNTIELIDELKIGRASWRERV